MTKELLKEIEDALDKRKRWSDRQQTFYSMRNGGLSRRVMPYPGAPNLHYPLGDTLIEKVKPGYVQQLYGSETITSFVARKSQDEELTSGVGYWFDYQVKQRSNFERTIFVAIDQMLELGFTPIKVYWDSDAKRLAFDQRDPLHVIVPNSTQEYNESGGSDWLVDVLHMSEAEYRANPHFIQDDELIKRIKGKGDKDSSGVLKKQSVDLKEGINCSADDNEIVLWEVYNRSRKSKKITVETISPLLPDDDNEVRKPFTLPYNKGCFACGEHFPFFKIRSEIKGKGYYSSRGLMEINAAFEGSLTKSWNTLHEWQDYFSKPTFSSTQPIPNAANFKTYPGQILPNGLTPNQAPPAPESLREDMNMTRAISEDRTQIPDLGASEHLTGTQSGGKPTATQINAVVGQSGQGSDMRARVFRLDLAEGLKMAWALCQQYASDSLSYLVDEEIGTLDANAIHDEYDIVPNGSADSWNKGQMVSKRMAYYQQFQGNPFVPLDELTKWLLEAEDPRLVKKLFRDPGVTAATQAEDQAIECLLMAAGYPAVVEDADDDKTHLAVMDQYVQDKIQKVEMTAPIAQLLLQHGIGHMGNLKKKKDPMLAQVETKLKPTAEMLAQIAAQPPPQPKNLINMQQPGGTDQSQVQPTAQPQAAAPISEVQPQPA